MKVLVLTYFYPPETGAPALRMQAITKAFVRRGWDVTVVTGMPQYPLGRTFPAYQGRLRHREQLFGARVERVFTYPTQRLGVYRLTSYLTQALGAVMLGTLKRAAWDVVFMESPPLSVGVPALWLAGRCKARLALDVTDLWPDTAQQLGLVDSRLVLRFATRIERALYTRAWRISCPTRGIARRLSGEKGVPADRIHVLPNGVDVTIFRISDCRDAVATEVGLEGRLLYTYAGLHGHAQALDTVVDAARLLRDARDIGFLFVGDGPRKAELVSKASDAGLDNVRFISTVPTTDAARMLAGSWASIVPLRRAALMEDAVPSKIITSLSAGAPVIYSGAGEGADLLLGHRCGLVVEPENPQQLADAVRWMREYPARRHAFASNGRALVDQKYQWERITDDWLKQWSHWTEVGCGA